MYTNFIHIARRVLGPGAPRHLMWVVPALAVVAFILLCSPAWRRLEDAARAGKARFGLLVLFFSGWLRLAVVVTVVAGLGAALMVQRGLFAEKHGRVTQRNYEAVKTKWGVPHHQRDLRVMHFAMQKIIQEELANGAMRERALDEWRAPRADEDRVILSEETVSDPAGVDPTKLNPRRVVRRIVLFRRRRLEQDAIVYAGYDDRWRLTYEVSNRSEHATQARFTFPLPAGGHGLFNNLSVSVDGRDVLADSRYADGALSWRMPMKPRESKTVTVAYESRGLEHFRYKPGNLRERCRVVVQVRGIPARRLNFPIGSMPPSDDLRALRGDAYALHWDLSRAVTNLDIGLIVPTDPQPGYHVTRVLERAPVGLALLAAALLLTRWRLGGRLDLWRVSLILMGYYVAHALLANVNDVAPSFAAAFLLSLPPVAGALTWFCLADGRRAPARASVALIWLLLVGYALIALAGDYAGTLTHILYAALLVYALALAARRRAPDAAPANAGA